METDRWFSLSGTAAPLRSLDEIKIYQNVHSRISSTCLPELYDRRTDGRRGVTIAYDASFQITFKNQMARYISREIRCPTQDEFTGRN